MSAQSMTASLVPRADLRCHRNLILAVDNREILERSDFLTLRPHLARFARTGYSPPLEQRDAPAVDQFTPRFS
jgi:hypothetical protein